MPFLRLSWRPKLGINFYRNEERWHLGVRTACMNVDTRILKPLGETLDLPVIVV